jgi:predicted transcriptional regulator
MEEKERRDVVIKFVSQNQGCTFGQIAEGVKDKISRVPAHSIVSDLVNDGIVKDEKVNRRDHRFFVDRNNPVIVTSREIDEFESVYIPLLQKVKEIINTRYHDVMSSHYPNLDQRSLDEYFNAFDLISSSFRIFSEVLGMYMLRSTILWPNLIKDKDFRNTLNSTVLTKFSDIQTRMHAIFGSIKIPKWRVSLDDLFHDPILDTGTNLRESFEKKFNDPSMKKESEKVLTFICKFIGEDKIRQAEYERTSKYTWDITQIDPEFIKKIIEGTYESHEDYENPFLKYKISL